MGQERPHHSCDDSPGPGPQGGDVKRCKVEGAVARGRFGSAPRPFSWPDPQRGRETMRENTLSCCAGRARALNAETYRLLKYGLEYEGRLRFRERARIPFGCGDHEDVILFCDENGKGLAYLLKDGHSVISSLEGIDDFDLDDLKKDRDELISSIHEKMNEWWWEPEEGSDEPTLVHPGLGPYKDEIMSLCKTAHMSVLRRILDDLEGWNESSCIPQVAAYPKHEQCRWPKPLFRGAFP